MRSTRIWELRTYLIHKNTEVSRTHTSAERWYGSNP